MKTLSNWVGTKTFTQSLSMDRINSYFNLTENFSMLTAF